MTPTHPTDIARRSDRELVITRTFDAPARLVFEAWTTAELFKQWWVPKSSGAALLSCEMDVRVGGGYRLEFRHPKAPTTLAFFGRYLGSDAAEALGLVQRREPGRRDQLDRSSPSRAARRVS